MPNIALSASDSLIFLTCLPITNTSSPSKCTLLASFGNCMGSPEATKEVGSFRNSGGASLDGDDKWLAKFIPTANTF